MNIVNLPSPGVILLSQEARRICARIISKAEAQKNATQSAALRDFFLACANAAVAAGGGTGSTVYLPAGSAIVANGASIPLFTSAGVASTVATVKSPGVATVAGGVLTKVTGAA